MSESLADHASDGLIGPVLIINTNPNAVAVAEIKLRQIAVQMPLRAMLIHALHAAFEDAVSLQPCWS